MSSLPINVGEREVGEHKVVTEMVCVYLNFIDVLQKLELCGCIQKIYIAPYYGEFEIYDKSGRLLGISKGSKLSLLRKDLQTDVAKVWYDAATITSKGYDTLVNVHGVVDPGLCVNDMSLITIKFLNSLKDPQRYFQVPVFYNATNLWSDTSKLLFYT